MQPRILASLSFDTKERRKQFKDDMTADIATDVFEKKQQDDHDLDWNEKAANKHQCDLIWKHADSKEKAKTVYNKYRAYLNRPYVSGFISIHDCTHDDKTVLSCTETNYEETVA